MYLVPDPGDGLLAGHVGSTDVDLALSLAVPSADDGAYKTLETNLKKVGLERLDGSSWRWVVEVDESRVVVELLGDDGETESGTLFTPRVSPPAGAGKLSLLCVRGVELAALDTTVVEREVVLLDGARSTVSIRVAGIAPFVALKADAYLDRREPKDVYDLIYVLRNWPGGPREAAAVAGASQVYANEFVSSALARIASEFTSRDHTGPRDYATFMTMGISGSEQDALIDDALLVWRQFESSLPGRL
jgi:predicted nucleotidyltransferase